MTLIECLDRLKAMRHNFLASGGMKAAEALTMAIEALEERCVDEAMAKDICRPPAKVAGYKSEEWRSWT